MRPTRTGSCWAAALPGAKGSARQAVKTANAGQNHFPLNFIFLSF
jgi:hypothetical protein